MRVLCGLIFALPLLAKSYVVDGIVVAVDRASRTMLVSHRAIAHYMPAMMMPFRVDAAEELTGLQPGARVEFELVVERDRSLARNVRVTGQSEIPAAKQHLAVGAAMPEFRLTDQAGRMVTTADLRGQAVFLL